MDFRALRDKTNEYISFAGYDNVDPKPNLAILVNEAYREVATEAEYNWTDTTFATVIGTTEYALTAPPDWIRIVDVLYDTTTRLEQTDEVALRRYDWLWTQASNGTPLFWMVSKPNTIRLYPPPSAVTTCYVHGSREPTALTADTDTPTIPVRYQEAIPLRAAWLHLKKVARGDEYERAMRYEKESQQRVADFKEELMGQRNPVFRRVMTRRPPDRLYVGSRISRRY